MLSDAYQIEFESPSAEEFSQLRSKIGWGDIDIQLARRSLANSLFHVVLRKEGSLLGMGRVVGDGAMYFYIQDLMVDPLCQKQGIGHLLMEQIENYLSQAAGKGATVGLLSAKGKEGFYTRYAYISRPNEKLGHGMCKFI